MQSGKDMVIYVADTSCCGPKIHDPRSLGKPCHGRRPEEAHLPMNVSYPECNILRYWEFTARRQVARHEIVKATSKGETHAE